MPGPHVHCVSGVLNVCVRDVVLLRLALQLHFGRGGRELGAGAAGSLGILIAGYSTEDDATADHELDHIASVTDLRQDYFAPAS